MAGNSVNGIGNFSNLAFNQVPDSDNRIHSDEMAAAYGYTGALVPGVTQSAYLIHPAIEAWGMEWLERGYAHVTIKAPLYDEDRFEVTTTAGEGAYAAQLTSAGRLCSIADVRLPEQAENAPLYQGHGFLDDGYEAPAATRANMERLQASGCLAKRFRWSADVSMAAYLRDPEGMPALLRTHGTPDAAGYANMAFLLGLANRHFAAVATMNPWIHLETRSWNHQPVALGAGLISEMVITDLFERKGHEFADCRFEVFRADTRECVCSIEQRAIYRVRPPART